MQSARIHTIIFTTLTLMLTACSVVYDYPTEQEPTVPVSVGITRAGESTTVNDRQYNLLFWTQGDGSAIPSFSSLFYSFMGKKDIGGPFYFTENGNGVNPLYYPEDNSPIRGVGYLPADTLIASNDYNTLSIDKTLLPAGFFDVCSTDMIEGTASSPFNNSTKRFDFKHTLVKLDFTAVKTVNVNARVSRIYITLKNTGIRDQWVYDPSAGYRPTLSAGTTYEDLVFYSGITPADEDFDIIYDNNGGITEWATGKDLFYEYKKNASTPAVRLKTCYIAHDASDTFLFSGSEGTGQAYIRLYNFKARLTKQGIAGAVEIENLPQQIDIPLTDMDGNPWQSRVKAGDAFKIYIVFDQNKIRLFGQKMPWSMGGRLYIPLDPREGTDVTY